MPEYIVIDTGDTFEFEDELIRCKDCRHYFRSGEKCQLIVTRLHFYTIDNKWTEDSFCSWAEKQEDSL